MRTDPASSAPMRFHLTLLALWLGVSLAAVRGQSNHLVRPVTVEECIAMALEKNLDIQIERYGPKLALNDLNIAWAGFEPTFAFSGQHSYSLTGGNTFDPVTGQPSFGSRTDTDSFSSSIRGVLPYTGMRYNLQGDVRDAHGRSGFTEFDNARGSVFLDMTQPLLRDFWIDQTRLNIAVARNRLKFSEAAFLRQVMQTVSAVEQAYVEVVFARESVKVQEKALELAERLLAENKKRVEVGALAPLDEKQAESQVAARRADLLNAQRALNSAQNNLKQLISDDYGSLHAVQYDPTEPLVALPEVFDLQESWRRGLTHRPEIVQSKLDLERNGIQLRFFKNQIYPALDVFGTYGHAASGVLSREFNDAFRDYKSGDFPFYTVGGRLSIPLGNTAARNRYKNGKIAVEQAVLALKQLEQTIMIQIDEAIRQARTSYERIDSTKQARLYAEAALDAEQKKLENGKSTSFVVLQLQRDLTSARSEEIRALADYYRALSNLALNEASTLERRQIRVEMK
jgi:outer membrane protein TolC